ncbi:MAG TPA: DHH family phosphoesterase [Candidatus Saccharimonadales bacterium]|nr:DHH family phosphoesterase [Candidatus Saccharimonadales bacterium]
MEAKLLRLIQESSRILVTSHTSPDPDAVASVLLMGTTLKKNFSDKIIRLVLEEEPLGLESFAGYRMIEFRPLLSALGEGGINLLILLDGNNFGRFSRNDGDKLRDYVRANKLPTVVIDHHQPAGKDEVGLYINQGSPATVQDVYELLFDGLGLEKPDGYARTTMLGLYADTGGFSYENKRHSDTLRLADSLIAAGVRIEEINNLINQYTPEDLRVLAELSANADHTDDYNYSFIGDSYIQDWLASGKTGAQLHKGTEAFLNDFLRNIGGRQWGFITYRHPLEKAKVYSASFRSVNGVKDVSKLAASLGGGGHTGAAGAKFEAESVEDAIEKVKQAIAAF